MSKITVITVKPGKKPTVKKIENTLKSLQNEVGGYIQVVYPWAELVGLVCDEEAKIKGKQLNRALRDENGRIYDIGRKPIDCPKLEQVVSQWNRGETTTVEAIKRLNLKPRTFYRKAP